MNTLYNFATGPLVWITFAVFIGGSLYRLYAMIQLAKQKDATSVPYFSWKHGLRSILHWITPFGSLGWKENASVCVVTFIFHLCLLMLMLFLSAHQILWEYTFGITYPVLPTAIADTMTIGVILACAFFAGRRLLTPHVAYITRPSDWLALCLAAAPFVTGFLAAQQIGNAELMTLLHVLAGEALLMAIPFTRLSHALFTPFTRAYIGSEFGGVRHANDW